tara:strand:+ start:817 stop:1035 length:219 start_codon:yes stop_codon:yes gene_type:complete
VFKVIKKFFDSVVKSYMLEDKPKQKAVSLADLEYKTKKELETIGRKIGIELDRRLTKQKLINRIKYKVRNKR